ncbi:MAG: twin-arginine translocase TatA/TatE family subunit [Chloroflexi bacterium]|nr:twin-arginine translocase TatA/TatE family subunit [Chloroflexota bacterium]
MNIFGVGIPEILVVLLLAALIFGPGKLPEIAGQFGRAIRELREHARDFRDEYLTDFEEVREEFIEQRFELQQIDADIRADIQQAGEDVRGAVQDAETMTEEAIEAARDGGGEQESDAAPSTRADGGVTESEMRRTRRVRRRPVVRPRRATAVAAADDGSDGSRAGAESAEPARPSNVISLNRRRRLTDHEDRAERDAR